MRTAARIFSGLILGVFVLVLAFGATGGSAAEAYVSYDNTKSNSTAYNSQNYKAYNYQTTTANYGSYNYTRYNNGATQNTTVYRTYNYYTYNNTQNNTAGPTSQPANSTVRTGQPAGGISTADEQAMLNLINKERAAKGLKPLAMDAKLSQIARLKAQDMIDKNYFSHQSPTYGSPFDMMKNNGITYHYAGENLAGAPDVNTAHTNLMDSPTHRANILSERYSKVGIGVVNGGPYGKMYVQEFTD
ncbi:CAP domain-containing protein [Desulforamulus hydrothermalis]|uniref:SCP-like extracellular n=1 Tax=Desulforamulus hydrothermalis Lam5 = DSM 18033 TaxID=1121428 RepID=K8DYT2_9FIRM|nr:CAP domain-containing protein [Desulforamulus hydrothermalis]CCO07965.1 SCP-like extracellular [Desulforamulus hydrothermalis Lam5 = DSM 18033]SHG85228.1 uncharacterized protein, YkwD family [Desulforamulus hydrothermalis Lam5 = DSM 18033]